MRKLSALEPLIGEWSMTVEFPGQDGEQSAPATSTFEWLLGGAFVLQRSTVDHPQAPDAHMVISADPERDSGYVQHYFDERGVIRIYLMTFDGRTWTLLRTKPDFSPLDFAQRFTGELSEDGRTIDGHWDSGADGATWTLDFRLRYAKL